MRTIYKYPLTEGQIQVLSLPEDYEILSVQGQDNVPCLWALVNPHLPKVNVQIGIYGTGHNVYAEALRHISTFQLFGGSLVFHAFEII